MFYLPTGGQKPIDQKILFCDSDEIENLFNSGQENAIYLENRSKHLKISNHSARKTTTKLEKTTTTKLKISRIIIALLITDQLIFSSFEFASQV